MAERQRFPYAAGVCLIIALANITTALVHAAEPGLLADRTRIHLVNAHLHPEHKVFWDTRYKQAALIYYDSTGRFVSDRGRVAMLDIPRSKFNSISGDALYLRTPMKAPPAGWLLFEPPESLPNPPNRVKKYFQPAREHLWWDKANDVYDNRLLASDGLFGWFYARFAMFIESRSLLFFIIVAAVFAWPLLLIGKYLDKTRQQHLQIALVTMVLSYPVLLVIGTIMGDTYIDHQHLNDVTRNISIEAKRSGMPFVVGGAVDTSGPHDGFFMAIGHIIYFPTLLVFLSSLAMTLISTWRYIHYLTVEHPAEATVVNHVTGGEFDSQRLVDELEPDVDLDDPAWKIRNRTKQAEELSKLYKANTKLAEEALNHERARRGRPRQ